MHKNINIHIIYVRKNIEKKNKFQCNISSLCIVIRARTRSNHTLSVFIPSISYETLQWDKIWNPLKKICSIFSLTACVAGFFSAWKIHFTLHNDNYYYDLAFWMFYGNWCNVSAPKTWKLVIFYWTLMIRIQLECSQWKLIKCEYLFCRNYF